MLTRLKISLVLMPLAIAVVVGIYVYSLWASERQRAADIPVESASMMMRDLLAFHEKRGGFPSDLKQLEEVVWEKKQNRNITMGDRALNHRNYFYLYTRLSPHRITLWAVPMGNARDEAATWFLVVTPEACRRWKGASLRPEDASKIRADASIKELGILGLVEQPPVDLNNKQTVAPFASGY